MSENSLIASNDRRFNYRLETALDLLEDLEGQMQSRIKQVNKLLNPKPKRKRKKVDQSGEPIEQEPEQEPERPRKVFTPMHRYAKKASIEADPEIIVRSLAQFDPTGRKATYMPWIVRTTGTGSINLPEDGGALKASLAKFHRIKKKSMYTGPKDIMQFKTFQDLQITLADFNEDKAETQSRSSLTDWAAKLGTDILEDERFKMVMYDPRKYGDEKIEILATAIRTLDDGQEYGSNWILLQHATQDELNWVEEKKGKGPTLEANVNPMALGVMDRSIKSDSTWCTSGPMYAMHYLEKGPLYMFFKEVSEKNSEYIRSQVELADAIELTDAASKFERTDILKKLSNLGLSPKDTDKVGKKVPFMLCDYHWSTDGANNRNNTNVSRISPAFFFFLCSIMIAAEEGQFEQFDKRALRRIHSISSDIDITAFQDPEIEDVLQAGRTICSGKTR